MYLAKLMRTIGSAMTSRFSSASTPQISLEPSSQKRAGGWLCKTGGKGEPRR